MSLVSRAFIALIGVVFLLYAGPSAYRTAESWLVGNDSKWWRGDDVIAPERVEELVAKGQRQQLISFRNALQSIGDQSAELFAIGVGQVNLPEPENIPGVTVTGSRQSRNEYTSSSPVTVVDQDGESAPYPIHGQFNNIVLFEKKKDAFTTVFEKRTAISSFQAGWRTSRRLLAIFAAEADSDGDGVLSSNDIAVLYVFTLDDKTLHRVSLENTHADRIIGVPNADYLLVQCRVDRNKDGEIQGSRGRDEEEPTTIMRVDLKTFAVTPFVPSDVAGNLQRILEGRAEPAGPQPPPKAAP
jgi:hypothetical protein